MSCETDISLFIPSLNQLLSKHTATYTNTYTYASAHTTHSEKVCKLYLPKNHSYWHLELHFDLKLRVCE